MQPGAKLDLDIQRLFIALSGEDDDLDWIDVAADMAARMEAELAALFVEDADLLRACRLPCVQELGRYSAQHRELDPARVRRALQTAARRAEESLRRAAGHRSLRFSFQVAQGKLLPTALSLSARPDALLIRRRAAHARRDHRPVAVLYEGGPACNRALALAARLARSLGHPCLLLIPARDRTEYKARREAAETWLGGHTDQVQRLDSNAPLPLAEAANAQHALALVVPAGYTEQDHRRAEALIANLWGDVLFLR